MTGIRTRGHPDLEVAEDSRAFRVVISLCIGVCIKPLLWDPVFDRDRVFSSFVPQGHKAASPYGTTTLLFPPNYPVSTQAAPSYLRCCLNPPLNIVNTPVTHMKPAKREAPVEEGDGYAAKVFRLVYVILPFNVHHFLQICIVNSEKDVQALRDRIAELLKEKRELQNKVRGIGWPFRVFANDYLFQASRGNPSIEKGPSPCDSHHSGQGGLSYLLVV